MLRRFAARQSRNRHTMRKACEANERSKAKHRFVLLFLFLTFPLNVRYDASVGERKRSFRLHCRCARLWQAWKPAAAQYGKAAKTGSRIATTAGLLFHLFFFRFFVAAGALKNRFALFGLFFRLGWRQDLHFDLADAALLHIEHREAHARVFDRVHIAVLR